MQKLLFSYFRVFLVGVSALLVAVNAVLGFMGVMAQRQLGGPEQLEPGFQYADLKGYLQGVRTAGFLSDGNQTAEGNDGQFMMAQYILAPTVLDLGNASHRYTVLDCSTPQAALGLFKIIQAKPLHVNPFGKIIAEKTL